MKTYAFGNFRLDLHRGELRENDEEISLEPRFVLLAYLVENAGRVIPREELLEKIWPDRHVTDASLSQAVASLRDALHDDVREPRYLVTLPRRRNSQAGTSITMPLSGRTRRIRSGITSPRRKMPAG